MTERDSMARLAALTDHRGSLTADLELGPLRLRLDGLDEGLLELLAARWGHFLCPDPSASRPTVAVELLDGGADGWLAPWAPGEQYRIEARTAETGPAGLLSYHFALAAGGPGHWRLGITRTEREPLGRVLDNAMRCLSARLAAEHGGFAMHAAGVLHQEQAWLLAGASGSGKTTAVGMLAPAPSIGDDFGLVLPDGQGGWLAPALPFDNLERIPAGAPRGAWPLAGVWRLHQAAGCRAEAARGAAGRAGLMAMLAFPWALPDRTCELLDAVGLCVDQGLFSHLHFDLEADLWTVLVDSVSRRD